MKKNIHIHMDPIGGISGDMFIASMISANPKLKIIAKEVTKKIINGINISIKKASSGHISGMQVIVKNKNNENNHHRSYNDIVNIIENSYLSNNIKSSSIQLFNILGKAESKAHGIKISDVKFHEIGAWDSIIDNIISASFIEYYKTNYNVSWSCGPLPIGKGKLLSAHGSLTVPAPATALLLKGFPVIEDGINGERTTPTGAAIINLISPFPDIASASNEILNIKSQGIGIGEKEFSNIPNILRTLIFTKDISQIKNAKKEIINKINFEIDDQTPEDLALSLNILKKEKGLIDINQKAIVGKKGRLAISITILCRVENAQNIIKRIFEETSTIGLKTSIIERYTLNRNVKKISNFNIKEVKRPSGKNSKKVESEDLKNYSFNNRKKIRKKIENK
ncbi:MAG: hypothetical protein CMP15_06010 [Rickettsiales bacterium]|nr:hypothetical protein [Rickettsiales bacterium]